MIYPFILLLCDVRFWLELAWFLRPSIGSQFKSKPFAPPFFLLRQTGSIFFEINFRTASCMKVAGWGAANGLLQYLGFDWVYMYINLHSRAYFVVAGGRESTRRMSPSWTIWPSLTFTLSTTPARGRTSGSDLFNERTCFRTWSSGQELGLHFHGLHDEQRAMRPHRFPHPHQHLWHFTCHVGFVHSTLYRNSRKTWTKGEV